MATTKVDVSPDVLVWARETIGLTRESAAQRLNMSALDLRYLEEGVGRLSLAKIHDMADVYDRPLIVFFLPEPPALVDHLPDFRTLPQQSEKPWSPDLHRAFRRAISQRDVVLEIDDLNDDEPTPTIDLHLGDNDDPEAAADRTRSWLGAPDWFDDARDSREILNAWVETVERHGVLVMQMSGVDVDEARGFSIGQHPYPVIVINNKDAYSARSFTLMHELTHVLLRRGGVCDLVDTPMSTQSSSYNVERFCSEVAAAVLIPRELMLALIDEKGPRVAQRWSFEEVYSLSRRFGVSAEAMLLRLVTLRQVSRDYYWANRHAFSQRTADDKGTKPGGGNYYYNTIHALGRGYISQVWNAYQRDDIGAADLIRYLGVKYDNVRKLIEIMGEE
jgi:Zn-dependent peptidase ImmA (M78 family)